MSYMFCLAGRGKSRRLRSELRLVNDQRIRPRIDHGVGRLFIGSRRVCRLKVECGLMRGAAQDAEGNAAPVAGDETMEMTGENMAHVTMSPQTREKCIRLDKPEWIECRHVNRASRVMHEDIDRLAPRLFQTRRQP